MTYQEYFKRYKKVYGVLYRKGTTGWIGHIYCFKDLDQAEKWLYREDDDILYVKELGSKLYCKDILRN